MLSLHWVIGLVCVGLTVRQRHWLHHRSWSKQGSVHPERLGRRRRIYEPMSRHAGGVTCLFGDGSVRFMNESVDTGNITSPPPDAPGQSNGRSPYGVWGSLGSAKGGDQSAVEN